MNPAFQVVPNRAPERTAVEVEGPDGAVAPARRFFIQTFGCQMNEHDSARMAELLGRMGWFPTGGVEDADLVILNTCSVREKAEQKLLSALGRLRPLKEEKDGVLLAVSGCVAQQEGQKLLKRAPYLDFVFGPDAIAKLPEMVARAAQENARFSLTAWQDPDAYDFLTADPDAQRGRVSAFITAMKGCDKMCSFCIVPFTRGREASRPFQQIVDEVTGLVGAGVREFTLIGQNVNSYAGGCAFPELLRAVSAIPGVLRIRYTTSHPIDFGDGLIAAHRELPNLCKHVHLPVQCGSDSVLERMRREYTVADYRDRIRRLRAEVPDAALTSDIIVGFPGETEEDFEATLRLVDEIRYDNLFSFVYSPRPHTPANKKRAEWGEVPRAVQVERLERLQTLQRAITLEKMRSTIGRTVEVLVEGPSKTDPTRRFGRTTENRVVHFAGDAPAGALVSVRVESASVAALAGVQA